MYCKIATEISGALPYLEEGRIVAFPTGTSYGLAVDALQGHALQRLRNLKGRPDIKTFTVFMAEEIWDDYLILTNYEKDILQKFANQPLTLLVQPNQRLSHLSRHQRIGLRVIDHVLMHQLGEAYLHPLTATSANLADQPPCFDTKCIIEYFPGTEDHVTYDLSLAYILDGGPLTNKESSTIARVDNNNITIIRTGAVSKNELTNTR